MKKTIVFYIATLTRGGAERVMANLANYFAAQGDRVYLATLEPEEGLYPLDERITQAVLKAPGRRGFSGRIGNAAGRVWQVRRLLQETQADVLVSFIGKTNLRAVLAGLGLRTKVVVSVRSAPEREYKGRFQRLLARTLFCLADGIVFQSEGARAFFPRAARRKSRILLNPLSPEYVRGPYRGKRREEIVTVGRMDEVKNHVLLAEAFALIVKQYPQMRLTIYGDGDCREAVRKRIRELGLTDRVSLPGDTRQIAEKIKGARVFVLSSDFEGMPNAVAEAMAMGIPVVCTDCPSGGVRMLIRDGESGLLVPVRDAEKLAEAVMRILSDPGLEKRLGENGYAFSKSLYPEKINAQWKAYLEELRQ